MRGQLSIQFNWIFVLLVGGIILAFFIMIINNQQERATVTNANELIISLDTVMSIVTSESQSVDSFDIPNARIEFECEPGLWRYFIQGVGPVSTRYDIIYTSKVLMGTQIITWTKNWAIPYDVANMIYLSNDKTLFIIINPDTGDVVERFFEGLYDTMPDVFRKSYRSVGDLETFKPTGFDRYVIITAHNKLQDVKNKINTHWGNLGMRVHIRAIQPDQDEYTRDYGTVTFSRPGATNTQEAEYFQEATLWGAIYSEDKNMYACNLAKAQEKHAIITEILSRRANMITTELVYSSCQDYFVTLGTDLTTMNNAVQGTTDKLMNIENMNTLRQKLKQGQEDSLRDRLCPYLY